MENITHPSALFRPAPFWSWNDRFDEAELRRQIREMAEKGWGSFFMHSRVGLVTGYLSDEWMQLCNACIDEAQKVGIHAWIYDEDKWPSGYAGGVVPRADQAFRSRVLVLVKKRERAEGDEILASVRHGGIDYEICKRVAPLSNLWFNGTSYVDLMNPDAVQEFIKCTHERYKKSCGEHFGKTIAGIFTDEPCYLIHNHTVGPAVPWSEYLSNHFFNMKGYDINEHLAKLFFDVEGYRKVRFDFYDAANDLLKESFTEPYYEWCTNNNLIMTGHFIMEESMLCQTQWCGDVMSHYEFMHWPGVDKLGRTVDPIPPYGTDSLETEQIVTLKQLSSVVDQLGKERALCETFGGVGGQVSFFHRKWIGDWMTALGMSFVNHHLSLYSMRGERKRDFPANLFFQQPWWHDERGLADYVARSCAFASEGTRCADILILQPLSSVQCEYTPLHKESEFAEKEYTMLLLPCSLAD